MDDEAEKKIPFGDYVHSTTDEGITNAIAGLNKKIDLPTGLADNKVLVFNASTNRFEANTVGSASITDGSIVNVDIATSAAIAYSKLTLTGSIVNADVATAAAIAYTKMAPFPGGILSGNTGQVIATGTETATIYATTEVLNTTYTTLHSGVRDGLVAVVAGTYRVTSGLLHPVAVAPAGQRQVQLKQNATAKAVVVEGVNPVASSSHGQVIVRDLVCAANDLIQSFMFHTQAASLTYVNDARTFLSVSYMGS